MCLSPAVRAECNRSVGGSVCLTVHPVMTLTRASSNDTQVAMAMDASGVCCHLVAAEGEGVGLDLSAPSM